MQHPTPAQLFSDGNCYNLEPPGRYLCSALVFGFTLDGVQVDETTVVNGGDVFNVSLLGGYEVQELRFGPPGRTDKYACTILDLQEIPGGGEPNQYIQEAECRLDDAIGQELRFVVTSCVRLESGACVDTTTTEQFFALPSFKIALPTLEPGTLRFYGEEPPSAYPLVMKKIQLTSLHSNYPPFPPSLPPFLCIRSSCALVNENCCACTHPSACTDPFQLE